MPHWDEIDVPHSRLLKSGASEVICGHPFALTSYNRPSSSGPTARPTQGGAAMTLGCWI